MKRYIQGQERSQVRLLPECLDDYIAEDNAVRVVDVFVDELDFTTLGFDGITPAMTGRPSYHPSVLLKLYIYGNLNRIQSSRRLERECQRNVELMWLTGRLAPDFKTIADFRKDNGKGIRNACKRFVGLCRERNFTQGKIERRERELEENIQRYLDALETADRTQPVELQAKTDRLQDKITKLRQKMKDLQEIKTQLQAQPDGQLSLTNPDARAMTGTSHCAIVAEVENKTMKQVLFTDILLTGHKNPKISLQCHKINLSQETLVNMKLLYRILAAPVIAAVLIIVSGGVGIYSIQALRDHFDTLQSQQLKTADRLGRIQTRMSMLNTSLYRTVVVVESLDENAIGKVKKNVQSESAAITAAIKALYPVVNDAARAQLTGVVDAIPMYEKSAIDALDSAIMNPGTALSMLSSAETTFTKSVAVLVAVVKQADDEALVLSEMVKSTAAQALITILVLTVVAVLVSISLAWWSARSMLSRVAAALAVSEALSRGELDVNVPQVSGDELGRLLESMHNTVEGLASSISNIQSASGSILNASSEIAGGSIDLSSRTETAASSLEETSASMDQLSHTVQKSADAATQADQLAKTASAVAARGGTVVSDVVSTMQEINTSSKRVFDIIGVIDGIAFQTNILALNAAVEAARAGEQGRGFAVVASEVRSLAHRSAEAAKEIKALIGASVDKITAGSQQVSIAGEAMNEIVSSVEHVSQVISEITQITREQSSSLNEVNQAISHLDEMTQQNAALAEQSTAAAESLKNQATLLAQVVNRFRLPEGLTHTSKSVKPANLFLT